MATSVRSSEALPVISGTDVNNILAKTARVVRRRMWWGRRRRLICVTVALARDQRGGDSIGGGGAGGIKEAMGVRERKWGISERRRR